MARGGAVAAAPGVAAGRAWAASWGRPVAVVVTLALAAGLLATGPPASAEADVATERVSEAADGSDGDKKTLGRQSVSADGRFVVFRSKATNLVSDDTNKADDIFLRDRQEGTVERVSVADDGSESNGVSFQPDISADGRYVVFASMAENLVADDSNGQDDIFVRDRDAGTTERVSLADNGDQGNARSRAPMVSDDGQRVAFKSRASNLVTDDTNGAWDAFVRDLQAGSTERVSVADDGSESGAGVSNWGKSPDISADGQLVTFVSGDGNLHDPASDRSATSAYVRDLQAQSTELVAVAGDGTPANAGSSNSGLSPDGQLVAFTSAADNLVAGDTNDARDVFVHDRDSGTTERVSVASDGSQSNGRSGSMGTRVVSAQGRFVAFISNADNLVAGDTNGQTDVFVHNRRTGTTQRVSMANDGSEPDGRSGVFDKFGPSISRDGRVVAFWSEATNLVADDTNGAWDVFARAYTGPRLDLRPAGSANTVGQDHTVTATVTDASGQPLAGETVEFAVSGAHTASGSATTDSQGEASFAYTGETTGEDTVTAFADLDGSGGEDEGEPSRTATASWHPVPPASLTLEPAESTNTVGEDHAVTATATDDAGDPVSDMPVDFTVSGEHSLSHSATTDAQGQASVTYTGEFPGEDTITAFADANDNDIQDDNEPSDAAAKTWQVPPHLEGTTERVSEAADGSGGDKKTLGRQSVSADGRFVVFRSKATNLVSGDTNGSDDIFLRDRQEGTIERVSVADDGSEAGDNSFQPDISADGRYVVFVSQADNLLAADSNGQEDIFVRDVQEDSTELVSLADNGDQGNAKSRSPMVSDDGQMVAFKSQASNLVTDDTNGAWDAFVRDLQAGSTERVSVADDGSESGAGVSNWGKSPDISADGQLVTFVSGDGNLHDPASDRSVASAYVRDLQAQSTELVSVAGDGSPANAGSSNSGLSPDGQLVAFTSAADNLVAGDTNGARDVFVHDRDTGATERVSVASDGTQSNGRSGSMGTRVVSAQGRFVAFISNADNLVAGDTNGQTDVFFHDRKSGATERASLASDGAQADGRSGVFDRFGPSISRDGRVIAFWSEATNLVADDTNGTWDVFARAYTGPRLDLRPAGASNTVGQDHTVTATVTDDSNQPMAGETVEFSVSGAHSASGTATTDSQGEASFSYTGETTGEDTVTAFADLDGSGSQDEGEPSRTATKTWFPVPPASLTLEPAQSTNLVGEEHTVTATATDDAGDPVSGMPVEFTVSGEHSLSHSATTDAQGQASVTYTGEFPGEDTITAFADANDNDTQDDNEPGDTATKTWEVPSVPEGWTERVSVAGDGSQGDADSRRQSMSANGRFVVFRSSASNLVAGDTNGSDDIFLRDRQAGTIERVSVADDESEANDNSFAPDISGGGRYVVFTSMAENLTEGDSNGEEDVFIRDREAGTTRLVSLADDGSQGNARTRTAASVSDDGQRVAFESPADNLVAGDTNGARDVFVRDLQAGSTERVSVHDDGSEADAGASQWQDGPQISADGQLVAFTSQDGNLHDPDSDRSVHSAYVRDLQAQSTQLVSVAADGTPANAASRRASLSPDGNTVAFTSAADNLVAGDTNEAIDVFVHDRDSGATERVSVASDGTQGNGHSGSKGNSGSMGKRVISADGRFVAFLSTADNLVAGDTNGAVDVFVHDRDSGTTERVSVATDGTQADKPSGVNNNRLFFGPSISRGGEVVAFTSAATNLVADDTNGARDVFAHVRTRLSLRPRSATTAIGGEHTVTATLRDESGQPMAGETVEFSVSGAHTASGSGTTDEQGQASFAYTGESTGEDTITAFADSNDNGTQDDDEPAGTASASWKTAALSLAPQDSENPVGQDHTVTATVTDGSGQPLAGETVEFAVSGAHSTSATVTTDEQGEASFAYTGESTGEDTITAFVDSNDNTDQDDAEPSRAATKMWFPVPPAALTLEPAGSTSHIGEEHTVTATATDDAGKAVAGMPVEFTVSGEHTASGSATTDDQGKASFTYRGWRVGEDKAIAFADANENQTQDDSEPGDTATTTWEVPPPPEGTTERVSVASDGTEGNARSLVNQSVSADGRFVAFSNESDHLVEGDTNGRPDVFVRDRQEGTTERVSVADDGSQAQGVSKRPDISGDGRYVVFDSDAENLVEDDTNGQRDVFIRDREEGTTERVPGRMDPAVSDDGRFVAFQRGGHIHVHDRQEGTTELVSVHDDGSPADNKPAVQPEISADGQVVAFASEDGNLHDKDTERRLGESGFISWSVYARDRQAETTELAAVDSEGNPTVAWSREPGLSADGNVVVFEGGGDLVADDSNGKRDVFVHERDSGVTERVSVASDGDEANGHSAASGTRTLSTEGRFVAFFSDADNLVAGDTNGHADVFVRDRRSGETERVSVASDGTQGDADSGNVQPGNRKGAGRKGSRPNPSMSRDGRVVAFWSHASNLVDGDTNGVRDTFVRVRPAEPVLEVGLAPEAETTTVGETHTVTATVADQTGEPAPDVSVEFSVSGAHSTFGSATTDAQGQASFTYTGERAGEDTITAFVDLDGSGTQNDEDEPSATATTTWRGLGSVSVAATAGATEPGGDGELTFTRSGGDVSGELTVAYAVSGSATPGSDYVELDGAVTFAAGSETAVEVVEVVDDDEVEGDETVTATLEDGEGYSLGEPAAATVTIADDDTATGDGGDTGDTGDGDGAGGTVGAGDGDEGAGEPASLVLSPQESTNTIGEEHVVAATVADADGDVVSDVSVEFAVSGAHTASGSATTDVDGGASFAYSGENAGEDAIAAFADSDGDGARDDGEPADTAAKTWEAAEDEEEDGTAAAQVAGGDGPVAACEDAFVPAAGFGDVAGSVHASAIECVAWYALTVGVGDVDGDGQDDFAPGRSVTRAQMASFLARLADEAGLAAGDAADAFADDDGSVHEANINTLAALGVTEGKGDVDGDGQAEFAPGEAVSRAQMASFLARLADEAGLALPESPPDAFGDDDGSVHEGNINALAALGVSRGKGDLDGDGVDEYAPGEPVSRAQMASFLARQLGQLVDAGLAEPGGADVDLDAQATEGGELSGTVTTHKPVADLVADGCGVADQALDVAGDGDFTLSIPDDQPAGDCQLTVTVTTQRPDADTGGQTVAHAFAVTIAAGDGDATS